MWDFLSKEVCLLFRLLLHLGTVQTKAFESAHLASGVVSKDGNGTGQYSGGFVNCMIFFIYRSEGSIHERLPF